MSRVLQVCLVQFYVCWLKPTSNSCINSVLGYECKHVGTGGMKNPSNPVNLTLPESQLRTSITNINMNRRHVFRTSSRHTSNCILFDRVLLCCPVFPLFYYTLYYIYPYIPLSTFPTSLHQAWNLWPAR